MAWSYNERFHLLYQSSSLSKLDMCTSITLTSIYTAADDLFSYSTDTPEAILFLPSNTTDIGGLSVFARLC